MGIFKTIFVFGLGFSVGYFPVAKTMYQQLIEESKILKYVESEDLSTIKKRTNRTYETMKDGNGSELLNFLKESLSLSEDNEYYKNNRDKITKMMRDLGYSEKSLNETIEKLKNSKENTKTKLPSKEQIAQLKEIDNLEYNHLKKELKNNGVPSENLEKNQNLFFYFENNNIMTKEIYKFLQEMRDTCFPFKPGNNKICDVLFQGMDQPKFYQEKK